MSSGSKIISKASLSSEEIVFCEELLSKLGIQGAFLGALKSFYGAISPVILQGKQLKVLKLTTPIPSAEKILLSQLDSRYQELNKFYPEQINQFGTIGKYFYYLRSFERSTLPDYLEEISIKVAEANYFVTKILNLILDLKRINFPHGHISLNNLIIDEKNLTLVDFGFAFSSSKSPGVKLTEGTYLAPESNRTLTSDFATDIYSFGKIIKFLYRGLQCPIPLDLPDLMCDPDPRKRPSLIDVNNKITETFTQKRNQTEHWSKSAIFNNELDPSKLYKGYLSPAILEQIRQEFAKSMIPAPIAPAIVTPPTPPPVVAPVIQNELARIEVKKNDPNFILTAIAVGSLLLVIYVWRTSSSPEPTNVNPNNQQQFQNNNLITTPNTFIPEPVKMTVQFLEQNKINRPQDYQQILSDIYNANYQSGKLTAFISPIENVEAQLIKVQALVLLVASNPNLLDLIYQDLEANKILVKYIHWFKSNTILDWREVANPLKLMILSGNIPETTLPLEFYFDLAKHFNPQIQKATRLPLNAKINGEEQKEFYLVLLNQIDQFDRNNLNFLTLALTKEKDLQLALISEWFDNTKPKNELVFNLVRARKKPVEGQDYFSFYAARYLREYLSTLPLVELEKLKNHHEKQLTIFYQIKKGG